MVIGRLYTKVVIRMKIKFWGTRGSIPVSGKEYKKYGGGTACVELRTGDDEIIIIDAGTGMRKLGDRLLNEDRHLYHILFTHAHWDHLMGLPFFKPIYLDKTKIQTYGCPVSQGSLKKMVSRILEPPNFPVKFEDVQADFTFHKECDRSFEIGSVTVTPIMLSHPNQGLGYRFSENGRQLVFLTDNELKYRHPGGLNYEDYLEFARGADMLIHDAMYTEEEYRHTKTWGHTTFTTALKLALEAGVKTFVLFHHNPERSDGHLDRTVDECRRIIREAGSNLECFAAREDPEHFIEI